MRLLIAGGGTGGHLFPAIAIAKAFMNAGEGNEVLFVGTKRGLEKKVLEKEGFQLEYINTKPLVGKGLIGKMKSLFTLPFSMLEAFSVIRRFRPDFALGVGGYSSGPVVLCAKIMRIKTGVQEQNIVPGMTNKILGMIVDLIFLAFKEAKMFFKKGKVCITGNPVRHSLFGADAKDAYEKFSFNEKKFTILVFGGSLGAESINKAFVNNLGRLDGIKSEIQVIHQTGEKGYEFVKKGYEEAGVKAYVTQFIFNMHDAYEVADIIVCRAGATTISEVAALEKAVILVPYPHAAGDHQTKNAEYLSNQNAAVMVKDEDLNDYLVEVLTELFNKREKLEELRNNIGKLKKTDAAKEIVNTILKKVAGKERNVSQG